MPRSPEPTGAVHDNAPETVSVCTCFSLPASLRALRARVSLSVGVLFSFTCATRGSSQNFPFPPVGFCFLLSGQEFPTESLAGMEPPGTVEQ